MCFQETGAPACIPQNSRRLLRTNDLGQKCKCTWRTIRHGHPLARERILGTKGVAIFHDERDKSRKGDILVVTGSSLRNAETVVPFKGRSCFARFDRKRWREKETSWKEDGSNFSMGSFDIHPLRGAHRGEFFWRAFQCVQECGNEAAREADLRNTRTGSCYVYIGKARAKMPHQRLIRKNTEKIANYTNMQNITWIIASAH